VADKCLNLKQDRACAFYGTSHHRSRCVRRLTAQHIFRRVLHFCKPLCAHLKDTNLIRRAEAVLHAAQNAVTLVPISFKIQDGVHHVFQHTRSRHDTFLGHMANNKDRDIHPLGDLHEDRRCLTHLRHASRRRSDTVVVHRLHTVDHNNLWLLPLDHLTDQIQIRLT